ncbi:MAG: ribose-5-phosphate isomerase RpiA [Anaerobiospirillum succiniciproducens]|uniref:ribose-5-phosphate isomerase RpiA n=1 Tax=Anaerobiospirillum succiniciproducens TaxID=13335 RepID=UPI0023574478|nr:ribose-5-phosphate isomerase RpiA [Anaerobiospirillum succiniciproducens]MCI6863216.1 ribose-5-phosphate isomerase RpiA [Anaerobiospirillum succiniciproducens]MDO4676171.1 ribose-5-phosphate isomerase RpiA [Anaerobiospirillum succiniciproducens]MDY2797604.1 ribose-5-phosphate isomerase RpiA [Anaerobiospirillum succiniciproducens]
MAKTQDELKEMVAQKALEFIPQNAILGVGSGSTVVKFIKAIQANGIKVQAAVSSSNATTKCLEEIGVKVLDPNTCEPYDVYIDGADEINENFDMIKGGGACLTREKILASMAKTFVCIVDKSKLVDTLGKFPLPVEVIPMAREQVARTLRALGGEPKLREGCITDNGCEILDVHGLSITNAAELEDKINGIPGVVTVGLFAHRGADVVLYATDEGVHEKRRA